MVRFEALLKRVRPDGVVVYGDVNSTLACALVAKKMHVRIAHVEAGLRNRDERMPEEVNRVLTDALSDILLTPSRDADDNLLREGVDGDRVFFVGNIMIDTLVANMPKIDRSPILRTLGLSKGRYAVLTLHRPSNVDCQDTLAGIFRAVGTISRSLPVVFPAHPRTARHYAKILTHAGAMGGGLKVLAPLGYADFLKLMKDSFCVLTDSGGIQEETTFLRTPCLTLRQNTERPVTVTHGTNIVAGVEPQGILREFERLHRKGRAAKRPERWDGRTAERIVKVLRRRLGG